MILSDMPQQIFGETVAVQTIWGLKPELQFQVSLKVDAHMLGALEKGS